MSFTYNQESAMKAGGTAAEGGKYIGHIKNAEYKRANSGSSGLELSFESKDGREFNYLTLWYKKSDGAEIKGGSSMINAIMGLTNTQQLSQRQSGVDSDGNKIVSAPELVGKDIGLLLQKCWYTKNDGTDGYKFEIRLPFNPKTGQTLKEQIENKSAEMVNRMESTLTDKDERKNQGAMNNGGFNSGFPQNTNQPTPRPSIDVPDDVFEDDF